MGRIGYRDTWCEQVAVVWEDGPSVGLNNPLIPMDAVGLLDPRPWYDFAASKRRRSRYSSPGSPSNSPTSRS